MATTLDGGAGNDALFGGGGNDLFSGDGDFTVLAAAKDKRVISEANLGYPIYGTPVVANGVLYVLNQSYLYAFADPNKTARDEVPKISPK